MDGLKAWVITQERDVLDAALLPPPVKKAATVTQTVEVLHVAPVKYTPRPHGRPLPPFTHASS